MIAVAERDQASPAHDLLQPALRADPEVPAPGGAPSAASPLADPRPSPPDAPATPAGPDLPPDFDGWFRDHRESVYKYIRFRVASRDVAEDLTSDVFMKALRSLGSYDPARSAPRTWLLRIARNAVADHGRMLRRRGPLHVSLDSAPDLVSSAPSQEERMLREERITAMLRALATLRPSDQEVLSLRYGAEMKNREIAEIVGISANAVAVRLHRALDRLRKAIPARYREEG